MIRRRSNYFHFHIFFIKNKNDTILSKMRTTPIIQKFRKRY
uniref:Uncharacterized protein n=1 Tax=Arundo donax TaxID=35708 RepID=A0A0A8YVS6_ARUDO